MPALPLVAVLNCTHHHSILISPCHSSIHQQTWTLPQPPEDAHTVLPHCFADNILLDLHAWTHQNPNENNDGDPEDAPEEDAVDADSIDPGTGDFWNKEDVDVEGEVDPRKGIILLWDILTEKFIVEAEEFGKFAYSLLDTW